MKTLALTREIDADNPIAGDLNLRNGQLWWREGTDANAQGLGCDLSFFLGEWYLDTREGLPFYRDILVKNPNLPLVASVYKRTILRRPGISHLASFSATIDPSTRMLTVTFQAIDAAGEPLPIGSAPMIPGITT